MTEVNPIGIFSALLFILASSHMLGHEDAIGFVLGTVYAIFGGFTLYCSFRHQPPTGV